MGWQSRLEIQGKVLRTLKDSVFGNLGLWYLWIYLYPYVSNWCIRFFSKPQLDARQKTFLNVKSFGQTFFMPHFILAYQKFNFHNNVFMQTFTNTSFSGKTVQCRNWNDNLFMCWLVNVGPKKFFFIIEVKSFGQF